MRHKVHANAALLKAIGEHDVAAHDVELRTLLHHVILANRFWFSLMRGDPFDTKEESRVPDSLEETVQLYRSTHTLELGWIAAIQDADLARTIETPFIPGQTFSIEQALMQVCLHSHGHRAQCATKLRQLGGIPPPMDFVLWLKDRPAPDWSS
ncbi:MAG TPA: DinB family protein [Candidatus Acidoferrales bacterium]